MRRRSVRAGTATLLSQAGRFSLSILSTMILARILRPDDFGLFAMAATLVSLFVVVRDLGLSTATVQKKEIDQEMVSTLFWMNVLFGLLVALLAVTAAPLLAWFFQEGRLPPVAMAMGAPAMIDSLAMQHRALLRRQMRFTAIAALVNTSEAAGIAAGVAAAFLGAGYWSLVILRVSASVTRVVMTWALCSWRPSLSFRFGAVRSMVEFGGFLTFTRVVRYASRNFDRFLVGRIRDAVALGYYTRASDWLPGPVNRLTMPIGGVAISTLSRLVDEPRRFRAYFRQGIRIVALLGTPGICFLYHDAPQVVLLLLGDQWFSTIPIFRRLAPCALATLGQMGFHWAFLSLGNARRQFYWECVTTAVIVAAILLGVRWGMNGVALAYSLASVLLLFPGAWYCTRNTPLRAADLTGAFLLPLAASFAAMAGLAGAHALLTPPGANAARLALDGAIFALVYLAALLVLPGGRKKVTDVVALLRDLRG